MKLTDRLSLCWRILRAEPGNCMEHADRELPPADGDEMQALMNQHIKEMVLVFGTHGHSGFSARYAIALLEKILRFQPLRPLTGEPEEWGERFDGGTCKQNKRAGNVFIGDPQRFNGQAYDIDAIVFREPTGSCFTGKGSAQPVIFPYTPRTIYVDVDAEGNPLNGWTREGIYPGWNYGRKMTDKDPIVGHKTYRDADGSRHEPLRQSEAGALMNRIEAAQAKREADMPTEQDAIRAMFSAWQRLRELGWRDGRCMPTTGERFATVQTGSTGIHACTAERRDTFGTTYTTHDGDLWPSSQPPTLFRPWRETDVQQDNGICAPLPDDTALRTLSRLSDEMGEEL